MCVEEERFAETLSRGMKLFEEIAARGDISGRDAFDLTATYGFPFELTAELALERGLAVDEDDFRSRMEEHREISRSAPVRVVGELGGPPTDFLGYDRTEVLTAITALNELPDGQFEAKLERSPFYPEGGGQVSDAGFIEHDETGVRAELVRASRVGDDQVLTFTGSGFAVGDRVRAVVPWAVRFPTMANHTATHLLHESLRRVLGDHVKQAGSAVRPDKLRFDFTHDRALTEEEREQVEGLVNEQVFAAAPVRAFETPIDEARKLGAQMLFGEKYGDVVRVIEIEGFSRELCGGTHVRSTAEIGPFVILSEASVGAGARRIEAVTSGEAFALLRGRAEEAVALRGELERTRKEAKKPAKATEAEYEIVRQATQGGVEVLVVEVRSGDPLEVSDRLKQQFAPAAVIVGLRENGAAQLVINVDKSLEARGVHAGNVVREAAAFDRRRRWRPADDGPRGRQAARGARRGAVDRRAPHRRVAFVKVLALDYGAGADGCRGLGRDRHARASARRRRAGGYSGRPAPARRARGRGGRRSGRRRAAADAPRRAPALQAQETERFLESLRDAVDVPVESFDERFTTTLAAQSPASRAPEDARAAAHLLESYLAWTREPRLMARASSERIAARRLVAVVLLVAFVGLAGWLAYTHVRVGLRARRRIRRPRRRRLRRRQSCVSSSRRASRARRWSSASPPSGRSPSRSGRSRPKLNATAYAAATKAAKPAKAFRRDAKGIEGFLFPATYQFTPKTTGKELVADQLEFFDENWSKVDLAAARKKNLTPYDVLIIASMVEKETIAPDERPKVAAVIYNRLKARMPLGIDATIRYGLDVPRNRAAARVAARERQPVQHAQPHRTAADADRKPRPRLDAGRGAPGQGRLPLLRAQAGQGAPLLHGEREGVLREGMRIRLRLQLIRAPGRLLLPAGGAGLRRCLAPLAARQERGSP